MPLVTRTKVPEVLVVDGAPVLRGPVLVELALDGLGFRVRRYPFEGPVVQQGAVGIQAVRPCTVERGVPVGDGAEEVREEMDSPRPAKVLVGQALDVDPAAPHGVEPEFVEHLPDRLSGRRAVLLQVLEDCLILAREETGDGVDPLGEHLRRVDVLSLDAEARARPGLALGAPLARSSSCVGRAARR